jgi:hypothetical protein
MSKDKQKKEDWDSYVGYQVLAHHEQGNCYLTLRGRLGNKNEFAIAKMEDYKEEDKVAIIKEFRVEQQSEAIAYFRGFADALEAKILVALNEMRTMVACIK